MRAWAAQDPEPRDIVLDVRPRVCTLSASEPACEANVRASWSARQNESLCLVIVDHPDIKRCWDNYSQGEYSVTLVFSEDLVVQLRDPELQQVLASKAVTVIREALRLRRKRRQPWNIFY